MTGLIQLYTGDGKGKTTAAVGLAVRAAGAGRRVLFAQFLKPGTSSEIGVLRALPGVALRHCEAVRGWARDMDDQQRERAAGEYGAFLEGLFAEAADYDLLVLDEAPVACRWGLLDPDALLRLLDEKPEGLEVVLTGRDAPPALIARADYVTEMRKLRHPYDRGLRAREGIEY